LPSPKADAVIFLPTETTYKKVHHDFLIEVKRDSNSQPLKYGVFLKLWHKLTPQIQIMKARTDLCDTCHKLRNEIHSCKDEEEKASQKKNLISTETKQKKKETITTKT
jgi:hypothetical protein